MYQHVDMCDQVRQNPRWKETDVMRTIHISNRVVGSATLTERPRGQGRNAQVPLYAATVQIGDSVHNFSVTRCSSRRVFNNGPAKDRYGWEDECPPNLPNLPYYAQTVLHAGTKSFALRLFEKYSPHRNTLRGLGPITRTNIMLHIGDPACSYGCLTVGGGLMELERLKSFLTAHEHSPHEDIEVHLAPRELPGRIP